MKITLHSAIAQFEFKTGISRASLRCINLLVLCLTVLISLSTSLPAADLTIKVNDASSSQIVDLAVVSLTPLFDAKPVETKNKSKMTQEDILFKPFVLPIRTGESVSFPNRDQSRHHVYSFSKAKSLELKLYGKDESHKVVFDKPGIVALGCNIHDNMLAYIHVSDHQRSLVTGSESTVQFKDLDTGDYKISVWHPDLLDLGYDSEITIAENELYSEITIQLKKIRRRQKQPGSRSYQ